MKWIIERTENGDRDRTYKEYVCIGNTGLYMSTSKKPAMLFDDPVSAQMLLEKYDVKGINMTYNIQELILPDIDGMVNL